MAELLQLVAILLAPLMVVMTLIAAILGQGKGIRARISSALALHSDKGLSHQGLLWLSILGPAAYFIAFGIVIWDGYSISVTREGLSEFIKISSLPLASAALSLPLSVLVSRFHATKQTAEQILITRRKNNLDLFYSHRKELFGYFDKVGEEKYLDVLVGKYNVHPRLHKNFFIGLPEDGTPERNKAAFEEIRSELTYTRFFLDSVIRNRNPELTESLYIANLCSAIYRVSLKLGLPEIYRELGDKSKLVSVTVQGEGERQLLTVGTTTDEIVMAYRYARNYFMNLCDFAGEKWINEVDKDLEYLESGVSYRTICSPPVIEEMIGRFDDLRQK